MINRTVYTGLIFFITFACCLPVQAQNRPSKTYSFEFSGQPLSLVLETVADKTGIDIVYDPKIVAGIHVYKRIKNKAPSVLLNSILKKSPLDFITLSSGTVVIVRPVRESPAYGSYNGKIFDSQTGESLPGASVILLNGSGGTSAGPSGSFALHKLVSGSYKIIFSYVGYQPVYKTISIKPGRNIEQKIALNPKPINFTPVVITGYAPQIPDDETGSESINPQTGWETTRQMQDPIRSLSLFSGVQYGMPLTDLHLQGGQRGQHRILLDGVPIYNPYSFGRLFSAFSPYAIGKVKLYKAGYEVPEGSHIAGLIDLTHDVNSVNKNRILVEGDPLSLNLRGDLYFPGKQPDPSSLKIMAAVRSNYWNIYREPTLKHTLRQWDDLDPLIAGLLIDSEEDPSLYKPLEHHSDVRFYDVHLATRYKIDSYNSLSSSFYTGKNYVKTSLLRRAPETENLPKYLYGNDAYRWDNFMGQITYKKRVSPRFDLSSQASFTSNRLHQQYLLGTSNNAVIPDVDVNSSAIYEAFQAAGAENRIPAQQNKNSIQHFILRTDGVYHFNPQFTFETGLKMDVVSSRVDLSNLFYLPTLSHQQSTFYSGYLNSHWMMGKYWKLTIGYRLTYLHSTRHLYSEPRASMQYDHDGKGFSHWNLRLAGGLYRQFINQYEITNPGPTALVPSLTIWSHAGTAKKPKAWHLSGSIHLNPAQNTNINLSIFYKWQPTSYTISYGNLLDGAAVNRSSFDAFAETNQMKSFGTGLRLKQSVPAAALQFIFGYDYSYNRIALARQFGKTLPPSWDEPHRFQLRTLWHASSHFTAVAKWQSILGRSWGFRQAYYNFLRYKNNAGFGSFSFNSPENDRLSPFHQLDFSFIYRPTLHFLNMEVRLDLINVLNRHNTIDWTLRQNNEETGAPYKKVARTMPGFYPTLSIQLSK